MNQQLVQGKSLDEYETVGAYFSSSVGRGEEVADSMIEERKVVPGGPGAQWRMMKLRRLYEQAEEQ